MKDRPTMVVVGGFLGAGKTTLILAAARQLEQRGIKSAIILNDQGESLVDTFLTRESGFPAGEVTGGCFCCQFSDLVDAAGKLRSHGPQVIFAEPVGSCTDISATVLRPLNELHARTYHLAPFTVCVDPARDEEIGRAGANRHLAFLFRNQLAEADLICYTKADLYPEWQTSLHPPNVRYVSALNGRGVSAWLDEVLFGSLPAGARTLNIDYAEYARAEAALAWLNMTAYIDCNPPLSPALLLGPLLDRIAATVDIVHLKAIDRCDSGLFKAGLCNRHEEPQVECGLDASPAASHEILLNLRAAGDPVPVRAMVEESMADLKGRILHHQIACFTPAPPKRPVPVRAAPRG